MSAQLAQALKEAKRLGETNKVDEYRRALLELGRAYLASYEKASKLSGWVADQLAPPEFFEYWRDQVAKNGGSIHADYRHWALQGWLAAILAAHEAAPQQEPIAWRAKFKSEQWGPHCGCSKEHYESVKANPESWPGYEAEELYAAPQHAGRADAQPVEPWEHLKQYGYAPGNYMSRCHKCGTTPIMDKRAITCRPCAEVLAARAEKGGT